jgi:hypothetical protein
MRIFGGRGEEMRKLKTDFLRAFEMTEDFFLPLGRFIAGHLLI